MKTDFETGYEDRLNNTYDKWYRYHRQDEGQEYDRGQRAAVESGKCKEGNFSIIELSEAEIFHGASAHNFLVDIATADKLNFSLT